jgi:S1-C subfamily serine protease
MRLCKKTDDSQSRGEGKMQLGRLSQRITLLFLVLLFSCSNLAKKPDVSLSQENSFTRIRDGLVHIGQAKEVGKTELEKWLGSGFFVDESCTVATAKHLFKNADTNRLIIRFQLPKERKKVRTVIAKILYEYPSKDIAFLTVQMPIGQPCKLGDLKPLPLNRQIDPDSLGGEIVLIAGFPVLGPEQFDVPIVRQGIISSVELTGVNGVPLLLLDLTGVPGFSGSPVILKRTGEVIGIVFGPGLIKRSSNFEWATQITQSDYDFLLK